MSDVTPLGGVAGGHPLPQEGPESASSKQSLKPKVEGHSTLGPAARSGASSSTASTSGVITLAPPAKIYAAILYRQIGEIVNKLSDQILMDQMMDAGMSIAVSEGILEMLATFQLSELLDNYDAAVAEVEEHNAAVQTCLDGGGDPEACGEFLPLPDRDEFLGSAFLLAASFLSRVREGYRSGAQLNTDEIFRLLDSTLKAQTERIKGPLNEADSDARASRSTARAAPGTVALVLGKGGLLQTITGLVDFALYISLLQQSSSDSLRESADRAAMKKAAPPSTGPKKLPEKKEAPIERPTELPKATRLFAKDEEDTEDENLLLKRRLRANFSLPSFGTNAPASRIRVKADGSSDVLVNPDIVPFENLLEVFRDLRLEKLEDPLLASSLDILVHNRDVLLTVPITRTLAAISSTAPFLAVSLAPAEKPAKDNENPRTAFLLGGIAVLRLLLESVHSVEKAFRPVVTETIDKSARPIKPENREAITDLVFGLQRLILLSIARQIADAIAPRAKDSPLKKEIQRLIDVLGAQEAKENQAVDDSQLETFVNDYMDYLKLYLSPAALLDHLLDPAMQPIIEDGLFRTTSSGSNSQTGPKQRPIQGFA